MNLTPTQEKIHRLLAKWYSANKQGMKRTAKAIMNEIQELQRRKIEN